MDSNHRPRSYQDRSQWVSFRKVLRSQHFTNVHRRSSIDCPVFLAITSCESGYERFVRSTARLPWRGFKTTSHGVISDSDHTRTTLIADLNWSTRYCSTILPARVIASWPVDVSDSPTVTAVPIPQVCGWLPQASTNAHIAGLAHALFETLPCALEVRKSAHSAINPRRLSKRSLLA